MDGLNFSFFKGKRGLNIDITHRCALECLRCSRQREFRNHGLKVVHRIAE